MIQVGQGFASAQTREIQRTTPLPSLFLMNESLRVGGTEQQFVTAARVLRNGFHIKLGCTARRGELLNSVGDISEFDPGNSLISKQAFAAGRQLANFLKEQKVQIAHSFDFYSNMLMLPSARTARVPVVIGSHRGLGNTFSALQQLAQALMFQFSDRIVCNCKAAAERLMLYGVPRHKLVVIPNFIPDEAFSDCSPAFPRKQGVLRLGMIARMNHPVKNHPLLLRAVARLVSRYPTLETLLVGDGPLRVDLERMASDLGIAHSVRFLGSRRDIASVLRSLDIAALTSDSEGLSNAILEAMAAGLPVVATRVGGNVELVEDGKTGFLFPVGSDEAFAAAVAKLLDNAELRSKMGMEARTRVLANYKISSIVEQFNKLYISLLRTKGVVAEA